MPESWCWCRWGELSELIKQYGTGDGDTDSGEESYQKKFEKLSNDQLQTTIDMKKILEENISTKLATLAEKYPDLNPCEFYFAMNYAYAVHYYPSFTIQNFIDIAFDEIHDRNVSIKHKIKEMIEYEA